MKETARAAEGAANSLRQKPQVAGRPARSRAAREDRTAGARPSRGAADSKLFHLLGRAQSSHSPGSDQITENWKPTRLIEVG